MKFCCTFLNKEFFPQNCPRIVWEEFTTRIQNADLQTIIFRSSRPMNITIAKSLPATSHNYTIHFPNTTYTKITNTEPRLHDNAGGPCCCTYLSKILRFPIEAPEELLYFCMSNPCPRQPILDLLLPCSTHFSHVLPYCTSETTPPPQ